MTLTSLLDYAGYHARDKWEFTYIEFPLAAKLTEFPRPEGLEVRIATRADVPRLEAEVIGHREGSEANERRYLPRIGTPDLCCFLGERDGRIVHYSWVFLDAKTSPLFEVPFDRSHARAGDVYVGPVFTDSTARGFIYPYVLASIVKHLRGLGTAKRIVVLVRGGRDSAVNFYRKIGFTVMSGVTRPRPWVLGVVARFLNRKETA